VSLNYAAVGVTAPRMVKGETPLGDATFLAMSELPLFVARYKSSGSTATGVSYADERLAITTVWSLLNVMRAMSENA